MNLAPSCFLGVSFNHFAALFWVIPETGFFHWPVLSRMMDEQRSGKADHAYALFTLLILSVEFQGMHMARWQEKNLCEMALDLV
jgi:hypothetical protein